MGRWIRGEARIEVAAPPEACFAVLEDMERYPEWQGMVESIAVHERDEHARPLVVETVAATPVRTVSHVMRYAWDPPRAVRWRQVRGDLEDLEGSYELEPAGEDGARTRVVSRLGVVPRGRVALLMRSPLFPRVGEWFMRQGLEELKARCEARG